MLTVFAAVAELEREYILQRQCEGIAIAKQQGICRWHFRHFLITAITNKQQPFSAGILKQCRNNLQSTDISGTAKIHIKSQTILSDM